MREFFIYILHLHEDEVGTSVAILMAEDEEDALGRAVFWINRKRKELHCGTDCAFRAIDPKSISPRQAMELELSGAEKLGVAEE
ncbi:MAG: hypothetical protein A2667_03330 [Candidatus Wildermuthbacteria bacterium RIFCSPHIGHO2_01_FULL_47_27]|nr:MAG: hypothetical protein A2667_03330 [Candidatus Wildermuthbacteria bacterium RIFCSPHIGHO2_01_FULL_47_27]